MSCSIALGMVLFGGNTYLHPARCIHLNVYKMFVSSMNNKWTYLYYTIPINAIFMFKLFLQINWMTFIIKF